MRIVKSRHWWGSRVRLDFTDEIDRGVELLDARVPGWERGINTERLSLVSGSRCVLGQVARNQWPMLCRYASTPFSVGMNRLRITDAEHYGFFRPAGTDRNRVLAWRQLTRQWRRRIEALQRERAAQREEFDLAR